MPPLNFDAVPEPPVGAAISNCSRYSTVVATTAMCQGMIPPGLHAGLCDGAVQFPSTSIRSEMQLSVTRYRASTNVNVLLLSGVEDMTKISPARRG
jgi:hypothetical protein